MTAKDLMIGDWVHSLQKDEDSQIIDIESLDDGDEDSVWLSSMDVFGRQFMHEIDPIKLTESIMIKNFQTPEDGVAWASMGGSIFHIEVATIDGIRYTNPHMAYVHELQHALKVCGLNIEIKL